jgi:hypothetical protein
VIAEDNDVSSRVFSGSYQPTPPEEDSDHANPPAKPRPTSIEAMRPVTNQTEEGRKKGPFFRATRSLDQPPSSVNVSMDSLEISRLREASPVRTAPAFPTILRTRTSHGACHTRLPEIKTPNHETLARLASPHQRSRARMHYSTHGTRL